MASLSDVPLLDDRQEDRETLRTLMREVSDGINRRDWSAILPWLDPRITITMIDQVTLHGLDAWRDYAESKLGRFGAILEDLDVDPVPDAPALFYGDTAVCTLSSADRFVFRNGKELLVQTKYTATLIKQDGRWKLVALHGGANAFNNPISYQAHKLLSGGIAVAGVGGLLLGLLMSRKG